MKPLRDRIDTIVYVMMENRSFDHMLGHLSFEGLLPNVDGLRPPLKQDVYENLFQGDTYYPFVRTDDNRLSFDLPHDVDSVAEQMAWNKITGRYSMSGFVSAYVKRARQSAPNYNPGPRPDPMSFFPSRLVPVTSFLARNFAVCDRWFCSIPGETQPNKTFALCGDTPIIKNGLQINVPDIVLDWLVRHHVRWRVYHDGLSFFSLYPRAWPYMLGSNFRDFEYLLADFVKEPASSFPQFIIVEPSYDSAPHIGPDQPNDDHAPLPVGFGQEFLRRVYEAVTANPARWARTVLIISYDEHGGFWDHVPPLPVSYAVPGQGQYTFASTGPRVPALVVSPLVEKGAICHVPMDHSSPLQLLGEMFGTNGAYSDSVSRRHQQGLASVSAALTRDTPRTDRPVVPSAPIQAVATLETRVAPADEMQAAFNGAARSLLASHPQETREKYPELLHWQLVADRLTP